MLLNLESKLCWFGMLVSSRKTLIVGRPRIMLLVGIIPPSYFGQNSQSRPIVSRRLANWQDNSRTVHGAFAASAFW